MAKLTLKEARAKLSRIQADIEAVEDYLSDACCDQEAEELGGLLEPVENIDFMLERLQ
jgi:hypothetical protein